jgi:hypothetical protein
MCNRLSSIRNLFPLKLPSVTNHVCNHNKDQELRLWITWNRKCLQGGEVASKKIF